MNKKQLFKFLKRQIEVSRFEAHVRRDLLKRLNKLHRQVSGRIGEENLDEIGRSDLNRLIKDITELSSVAHKDIAKRVETYSLELIESETAFVYSEMGAAWGVPKNKPSIGLPLILGVTAEEWLTKQASDYSHSIKMAVRNNDPIDHLPRQLANKNKAFTATWSRATSQHVIDVIGDKSKNTNGWWHVSVLDGKTSDICLVRSNKRWDSDKKPVGHDLPWKMPPLHPHCRSSVLPIVDVSKEPATMTVEEWLDDMSESEQEEILGVGKASMYRDGKITLRDLLDQSGRPQSLRTLKHNWFTENSRARLIAIKPAPRDEKEIARLLNGATDPKAISEVNTAVDYQRLNGVTLENAIVEYDENKRPLKNPDFVIKENGKTIDAMYSAEGYNEYKQSRFNLRLSGEKNWLAEMEQINKHLQKADIVLMDIRSLTNDNKDKILNYVVSLSAEKQQKIEIIDGE